MSINSVPTLILGLGGIGSRIAKKISDTLSRDEHDIVGFVVMDTEKKALENLDCDYLKKVQTSDEREVSEFIDENLSLRKWFPVNRYTLSRGMKTGAGQIRAISRLAAIAAEKSGKFIAIDQEINRIRQNRGGTDDGSLTVMVVGSITGGTGAGLFIQMPYYIRKLLKDRDGIRRIIIRGMFVGPDITEKVQDTDTCKKAVYVNAYSCIKELNAIYRNQLMNPEEDHLEFEYYDKISEKQIEERASNIRRNLFEQIDDSNGLGQLTDEEIQDAKIIAGADRVIPYDYLYLIEDSTSSGTTGEANLANVEDKIAQMVHTLMFTDVQGSATGVEDNFVLELMKQNGMGRYAGCGICKLVYPADEAKKYVALRQVAESVKNEWLLLDNRVIETQRDAESRKLNDPNVVIPDLEDIYTNEFDEQSKNGRLRSLRPDVYIIGDSSEMLKAERLFKSIVNKVQDITENNENVKRAREECVANRNEFKSISRASKEIDRLMNALDHYSGLATRFINDNQSIVVNDVFPTSMESMNSSKLYDICIYNILANVHPIAARCICYHMINILEKELPKYSQDVMQRMGSRENYKKEDYDLVAEGTQSPSDAVALVRKKRGWFSKLFITEERSLATLTEITTTIAETHVKNITSLITSTIMESTCRELLKRFGLLAKNYERFFGSIKEMIEENKRNIENLENIRMPIGKVGVYCNKQAFETMASNYQRRTDILPETKEKIFNSLFTVTVDDFVHLHIVETDEMKKQRDNQKMNSLKSIFNDAIVIPFQEDVYMNSKGVIDFTIRQALERQFYQEEGKTKENCNTYDEDLKLYIREQINKAMVMANPMIAVKTSADGKSESVYLAIHPDCSIHQEGVPNDGLTKLYYAPQANASTDNVNPKLLIGEEFSDKEITCFKSRYLFTADDLVKYAPGSRSEKRYSARIMDYTKNFFNDDRELDTVTPHLDRYWHEEGFLPPLTTPEQKKSISETNKAFVYALAMGYVFRDFAEEGAGYGNSNRKVWYASVFDRFKVMHSCGVTIKNSFADLYNAFPFNGNLKRHFLYRANQELNAKRTMEDVKVHFEKIMSYSFIDNLVHKTDDSDQNVSNILDIVQEILPYVSSAKLNGLVDGIQETIWEMCAVLFDRNVVYVNMATNNIIDKIYENSRIGLKEANGENLLPTELNLRNMLQALHQNQYN